VGRPDPDREPPKLTLMQRSALREIRRKAGKSGAEPLGEEDWAAVWELHGSRSSRLLFRLFSSLPSSPRCSMCAAPFGGPGRWLVAPLGYRPSRKNPHLCDTCVEASPPGGTTLETGVLFADLRGFTAHSEGLSPREVSATLRRFYRCAEDVLFPQAIIDKLIGDEVMALYLPRIRREVGVNEIPALMVEHARALQRAVGYGSRHGPFVELGIGLDFGEAFVGNIGDRALYDFTAVGDVVNTASRLQEEAAGGEIVLSGRVAAGLRSPPGTPVSLRLKGKAEPLTAYRIAAGA
jgi:adenylate cyclase